MSVGNIVDPYDPYEPYRKECGIFAFDWRLDLFELGRSLAEFIRRAFDEDRINKQYPLNIAAHSMGCLVFMHAAQHIQDLVEVIASVTLVSMPLRGALAPLDPLVNGEVGLPQLDLLVNDHELRKAARSMVGLRQLLVQPEAYWDVAEEASLTWAASLKLTTPELNVRDLLDAGALPAVSGYERSGYVPQEAVRARALEHRNHILTYARRAAVLFGSKLRVVCPIGHPTPYKATVTNKSVVEMTGRNRRSGDGTVLAASSLVPGLARANHFCIDLGSGDFEHMDSLRLSSVKNGLGHIWDGKEPGWPNLG